MSSINWDVNQAKPMFATRAVGIVDGTRRYAYGNWAFTTSPGEQNERTTVTWWLKFYPLGEHARAINATSRRRFVDETEVIDFADQHLERYGAEFETAKPPRKESFIEPVGWSIERTKNVLRACSRTDANIATHIRRSQNHPDGKYKSSTIEGHSDIQRLLQSYGEECFVKTLWHLDNAEQDGQNAKTHDLDRLYRGLDDDTKYSLAEIGVFADTYQGKRQKPFNVNRYSMEEPSADTYEYTIESGDRPDLNNVFDLFRAHIEELVMLRQGRRHWASSDMQL